MSNSKDSVFEVESRNDSIRRDTGFSSQVYGNTENDGGLLNSSSARKTSHDSAALGEDGFELFDSQGEENGTENGGKTDSPNSSSESDENFEPGEDERSGNHKQIGSGSDSEPTPAEINVESVKQGDIGNCFFVASLASLANTSKGQQSIRDMVTKNDDGSFTVTFPGDKSHPISVTQQDIEENVANGNVEESSDALMQVQTAFLKYDRAEQYGEGINAIQHSGIPVFAQIRDAGSALHLLTGEDTASKVSGVINSNFNLGGANRENVARFIQQAFENGQPVIAGTPPWADEPIVSSHVYSVLGYDPATDMVTVRNPWGHNDGHGIDEVGDSKNGITNIGDGKLTMSYETFFRNFDEVGAAGANPTETRIGDIANDIGNTFESQFNVGSDILNGRFREVLPDVSNLLQNYSSLAADLPITAINQAESLIGARIRGGYNVWSRLSHLEVPSLSDVANATLVPAPVLDAADTVVSKVGDILGSIF